MLKLSCDVISDLLPLYYDDASTTDSRSLVEAHLKDCAACRSMLEKIHTEYRLDNMRQQHEETMLKNMVVFWNKSLLKSFLKGIYTASCILLLLSAVCVGLVRWPFVTVSPAAVLTNATVSGSEFVIHLKTTDGYKTISIDQLTTEDGKLFIFFKRGIIPVKSGHGTSRGGTYSASRMSVSDSGKPVRITEIYYGTQNNCRLLWK